MEAMTKVDITEHWALVVDIAAYVESRYRGYVEKDDLQQEAAIWWYGRGQKHLERYLENPADSRLRVSIYRHLEQYARAEKAQRVGYSPRDQYSYQPRVIADLLPIALDPDGLPLVGHQDEGPAAKGNLAEGGDVLAALVDVRRALHALPEDDVQFLHLADDCGYDWERVVVRYDGNALPDSLRRRYARIAERMARWLSNESNLEDYQ